MVRSSVIRARYRGYAKPLCHRRIHLTTETRGQHRLRTLIAGRRLDGNTSHTGHLLIWSSGEILNTYLTLASAFMTTPL